MVSQQIFLELYGKTNCKISADFGLTFKSLPNFWVLLLKPMLELNPDMLDSVYIRRIDRMLNNQEPDVMKQFFLNPCWMDRWVVLHEDCVAESCFNAYNWGKKVFEKLKINGWIDWFNHEWNKCSAITAIKVSPSHHWHSPSFWPSIDTILIPFVQLFSEHSNLTMIWRSPDTPSSRQTRPSKFPAAQ